MECTTAFAPATMNYTGYKICCSGMVANRKLRKAALPRTAKELTCAVLFDAMNGRNTQRFSLNLLRRLYARYTTPTVIRMGGNIKTRMPAFRAWIVRGPEAAALW
jgi:hypothetical protein